MITKFHAHERCKTLRKTSISTRGYAETHIQRPNFDNKKSILKNSCIENPYDGHMLVLLLHIEFYIFEKY
jgi:hypothetical protein